MVLSDQIVESKILDIIWQASKHGALKPRILIESVIIGGVTINYLTGHNARYIKDNVLGPGAIIKLTLVYITLKFTAFTAIINYTYFVC